jgi:hypothetical protein
VAKKEEEFSAVAPATAAEAFNLALWGPDIPLHIQAKAAIRAKALEQQIRLIVDERVRNVPIHNRVRLLYTLRDAAAAIGCGHSKLYDLINHGMFDIRRFGKRTLITAPAAPS